MLYAAYGSNLDPAQMSGRCPHSPLRWTGWIPGWRLTFGGEGFDGALPTVVEARRGRRTSSSPSTTSRPPTSRPSTPWESADAAGLYQKVRVRVETLDGIKTAWVYVLDDFEGGMPSARTLGILADAAQSAGAPEDYLTELRGRPCRSGW